jgi:hypothetical protein
MYIHFMKIEKIRNIYDLFQAEKVSLKMMLI